MNREEQKLLLNQVRHRILQYVLRKGSVTVKEIGDSLKDIPQASLYRQIKLLSDNGFLVVCGQKQVRGTLEHTYSLAPKLLEADGGKRTDLNIQFILLSIAQDFADYYSAPSENSVKDVLNLISSPILMSDDEFEAYMEKISELTKQYINNEPCDGRKARRVTLVSSPAY